MQPWELFLNWFLPQVCYRCGQANHWWCQNPALAQPWPRCFGCRRNYHPTTSIRSCRNSLPLVTLGAYDDPLLKWAIADWKYQSYWAISQSWAELLAHELKYFPQLPYIFVPIPLHDRRRLSRGFSQSLALANQLANLSQGKVEVPLIRHRQTAAQAQLPPELREKNVIGAFRCLIPGKGTSIWLVDDVVTTGATCQEARKTLEQNGWRIHGVIAIAHSSKRR